MAHCRASVLHAACFVAVCILILSVLTVCICLLAVLLCYESAATVLSACAAYQLLVSAFHVLSLCLTNQPNFMPQK